MILRLSIFGLLLVLIAVIALTIREGFTTTSPTITPSTTSNAVPRVNIARICKDGVNIKLYGTTTSRTPISAKIVYSTGTDTIIMGNTSNAVLASDLIVSPSTGTAPPLITTIPKASLMTGKTYYMIDNQQPSYRAGITILLASFQYIESTTAACSDATTPPLSVNRMNVAEVPTTAPDVSVSGESYDALSLKQRSDLLRDIKKLVRNEIISSRQFENPSTSSPDSPSSNAMEQGRDFSSLRPSAAAATGESCEDKSSNNAEDGEARCPTYPNGTCPPVPDMSKYIRKDAIPCWGCAIDF